MLQKLSSEFFKPNKRAAGIEPASSAWKAEVLPLNYARTNKRDPRNVGPFYKYYSIMTLRVPFLRA